MSLPHGDVREGLVGPCDAGYGGAFPPRSATGLRGVRICHSVLSYSCGCPHFPRSFFRSFCGCFLWLFLDIFGSVMCDLFM